MKPSKKDLDQLIDKTMTNIQQDVPDAATATDAAARVWANLAATEVPLADLPAVDQIRSCADFQALIPAYLQGKLSEARLLLFEDHSRECIPCRKALKLARSGEPAVLPINQTVAKKGYSPVWKWVVAAGILITLSLVLQTILRALRFVSTTQASVISAEGPVYRVAAADSRIVKVGENFKSDETIRTAKQAEAMVRLNDGSMVEMSERSEFTVSENEGGITIHLKRGNIIVQAAKQHSRHLYVATDDCLVSVTGTIFSVNNGTKGSRVSVVEGEVHVEHDGQDNVLHPGQQQTTSVAMEKVPIKDEISWSRNAEQYFKLLEALTSLGKELATKIPRPEMRYDSNLLKLQSKDTVFFASLPNISTTLTASYQLMKERIAENPALNQWWRSTGGSEKHNKDLDFVMEKIRLFGQRLGPEITISLRLSGDDKHGVVPLIMAELKDSNEFRPFLEAQFAEMSQQAPAPKVKFVDEPMTTNGNGQELYIWVTQNLLVISPELGEMQRFANSLRANDQSFLNSSFYHSINEHYKDGAGLVIAADLQTIIARYQSKANKDGKKQELLAQMGLTNLNQFIFEQSELEGVTHNRATITFNEQRRGITAWLAAPGPMGALEYISPEANVVAAFVVKEPTLLVDDLLGYLDTVDPKLRQHLNELQNEHGFNLRDDFAAPLGGEMAFAIDGPLLPTPSWKMVVEVNDTARLQQSFERLTAEINRWAEKEGKRGFSLQQEDVNGRSFYLLKSLDHPVELHYAFVNGYFIGAPNRALIDRAIRYHDSNYTLLRSPRFINALPEDGNANVSALFYYDVASVLAPLAQSGLGSAEQQRVLKSLADGKPMLGCAYAYGDRIIFAVNTEGPFGLNLNNMMLGMPGPFGLQKLLDNAMKPTIKK